MKTSWVVLAAVSILVLGCSDSDNGDPKDAAVEAGLTPDPECDKYLSCYKAAKTPAEYDEEYKLFKAGGPCWANKANCINLCKVGYDDLAKVYTTIPACGGTIPDGGLDKGPDLGGGASTGLSCSKDTDCQGGKCLKEIIHEGNTLTMKGGYCSRDCISALCKSGATCYSTKDKDGKAVRWCTRACVTSNDCRISEGYTCDSLHSVCLPGSSTLDGGP